MIKAPYNFVPLNEKVFYPPWADQVSHDIPFSDGESGEIEIEITAKSPIFIRNHEVNGNNYYTNKNGDKISTEFCNYLTANNGINEKRYYIPGTSLKGMIRNTLEIMSFSKIPVDDKKFQKITGVRDMTPIKYCNDVSIKRLSDCPNEKKLNRFNNPMVAMSKKCGLVNLSTGEFSDYGDVLKIKNDQIERAFPNSGYNYQSKSIYDKYENISPLSTISVVYHDTSSGQRYYEHANNGKSALLFMNEHFGEGHKEKKYEFILLDENCSRYPRALTEKVIQNFKDVYFRETYKDKESSHWDVGEYWENKYVSNHNTLIPVFYTEDDRGNITSLGLTQVYKLPYNKTFLQASNNTSSKLDMSETIFGTVNKDIKFALKGRVQFSHFEASTLSYSAESQPEEEVLSEPKHTYYPNYIRQTELNDDGTVSLYKTLMDTDVKISGWKRYPLRQSIKNYNLPTNDDGSVKYDLVTKFKPLDTSTTFKGKIRFHNLKKVEIGALISALTFHGNEETNYHNIGMAKPLGYGKIKIKLTKIRTRKNVDRSTETGSKEDYLKEFESYMQAFNKNWLGTEQIKELLAMTKNDIDNDNNLIYQSLENSTGDNDFASAKKSRHYLRYYSYYLGDTIQTIAQFANDEDIAKAEKNLDDTERWIDLQKDMTLEKVENFIKNNSDSPYLKLASEKFKFLKKKDLENKAKKKLEKAQATQEPWRKEILQKFIEDYNDDIYLDLVKIAKRDMDAYNSQTPLPNDEIISLDNISEGEQLIQYLNKNKNKLQAESEKITAIASDILKKLDSKKKKLSFLKKLDKATYKKFAEKNGLQNA